jgi:hypothetical protein
MRDLQDIRLPGEYSGNWVFDQYEEFANRDPGQVSSSSYLLFAQVISGGLSMS